MKRNRIKSEATLEASSSNYNAGHRILSKVNKTKADIALEELEKLFN